MFSEGFLFYNNRIFAIMPVTNIQARSTVCLHHAKQLLDTYGNETIADIVANMENRLLTTSDYPYRCPKCKGLGDYPPETDNETLPVYAPVGNIVIAPADLNNASPARITCSVCSGEGYTAVQVQTTPTTITYSNVPTP